MQIPAQVSYEEWIDHCFDRPVTETAWYFTSDEPDPELPQATTLAYLTRLFLTSKPSLACFTDEQVSQGLWYIVPNTGSEHMYTLVEEELPEADRIACLHAIGQFYADLFSERCSNSVANAPEAGVLNGICYMWFDVMPIHPTYGAARRNFDAAAYEVFESILALDSIACQEAALHALGHWADGNAELVHRIIGEHLARMPTGYILRQYALEAKVGNVQ